MSMVTHEIARLVAEPLSLGWTAADATRALRGDDRPFVLSGAWAGGSVIAGSEPVRVARPDEDPFALLDDLPEVEGLADAPAGAVGGGWFGHLGFALGHLVERLPPPPPARDVLPPFALALYDHILRRDADGRWWFEALVTPGREEAIARRRAQLVGRVPVARPFRAGPFTPAPPGTAGLRAAVAECVGRIAAGELFQANLTLRLEGAFAGDPIDAFAAGVALQPVHGAFVAGPWGATVGLSPELFLRRRGADVLTRPIKGTRPRVGGSGDAAARAALVASAKDNAENVMIVDLMRNDLGRVCAYGTVRAEAEPVVEAHPGVWHLVSSIRGRLREGVRDADLLRATFPPGSVTGAPKVQALLVISELEGSARHAYTGAVGFVSPVAGLELNVVIRTFEIAGGRAWIGAGGGIVADSDPDAEVHEALDKARPLIAALGAELRAPPDPPRRAHALPRALEGGLQRPEPALGVFETIAVREGRPVALEAHLARLTRGAAAVLGVVLPGGLRDDVAAAAAGAELARLRIDVAPGGVEITVRPAVPPALEPVALAPVVLPGGLGEHKWRDRSLLDALTARLGAMPLLVDADGSVLEAAISNVWILEGDALVTPPADGRILPGVTRARLLAAGAGREDAVDLARLHAADAVLLSSSIGAVRVATGARRVPDEIVRGLWRLLGVGPPGRGEDAGS
jgi:para-aminobenzoate synthetase / 4-amino-4-deoxychorismate lyase